MIHVYNCKPSPPDERDFKSSIPAQIGATYPDEFDLRNLHGKNGICIVPEIKNQYNLGCCTGFGSNGIAEIDRISQGYDPIETAEMFTYYNERMIEGDISADAGAQVRTSLKALANYGLGKAGFWPYVPSLFALVPPPPAYQDAATRLITKYESLNSSAEAVCQAIYSGKSVVFGFDVYDSFEGAYTAQTGIMTMPLSSEKKLGGHCVCAIGYEITKRGVKHGGFFGPLLDRLFGSTLEGNFIIRNSWGTDWGNAGYCLMPFKFYTKYAYDAWVVDAVAT